MGTTYSTESLDGGDSGPRSANNSVANNQAKYLSTLRRLVIQEQQNNSGEDGFTMIIWQCAHLLSLNNTPTSSDSVARFEAHLMNTSPTQLEIVKNRCEWLNEILSTFTTFEYKMNSALEDIFADENQYLERISNIVSQQQQPALVDFLCSMCCDYGDGNEDSISAKNVIEMCFQMASISHCIFQGALGDVSERTATVDLLEMRNTSSEIDLIQSMTNSLIEYAKSSRHDNHFGGFEYADPGVQTTNKAATLSEGRVTKRELSEWQRKAVPDLISCSLVKFMHILFFSPGCKQLQQQTQRPHPIIRCSKEITSRTTSKLKDGEILPVSSHIFGTNTLSNLSPQIFAFSSISQSKFGEKWYRIFAGEADGWTFQSLEHAIMGYEGPTLLVIQGHSNHNEKEQVTFGAYTASKWEKNKRDFFGSPDCFLYQLQPTLRVLKTLPKMGTRGGKYMYFHSNSNVNTSNPSRKDDLAVGLGFGGTVRHPRLFIDYQLEECSVTHQDTSFEEGYLGLPPSDDPFSSQSFSSTIHIDILEIYAVGDEDTIQRGFNAQYQHRDIADATLRNARKVDKAAFLGELRNEGKGVFAHRGQVDGRAHGHLKGEEDEKANGL